MSDKEDAERYRWLRSQKGLELSSDCMQWTREDGSKYISSHRLCANDIAYSSFETLDETIDEAIMLMADRESDRLSFFDNVEKNSILSKKIMASHQLKG